MIRVGIFGWGLVAPQCPDVKSFARALQGGGSWLEAFRGFSESNFLTGTPTFDLDDYRDWIVSHSSPSRYLMVKRKLDETSHYAIGAFIQSLEQNPGIESCLESLGKHAHVYVGTTFGAIPTISRLAIALRESLDEWDGYWADPANNSCLASYLKNGNSGEHLDDSEIPPRSKVQEWNRFWASRSPQLADFLKRSAEIESCSMSPSRENGKAAAMTERARRHEALQRNIHAPLPPWCRSEEIFWNLHNTPAGMIYILGKIKGLSFAPVAACSTFGIALRLAVNAIRSGEALAVVVGATDATPHGLTVGAFNAVKAHSAVGKPTPPLTTFQGTHIAGGAAVWIVGNYEWFMSRGFQPLGMEICGVGVSSEADHLLTPSPNGQNAAIKDALHSANVELQDITTWDLHATGTPGDWEELQVVSSVLPKSVLLTARKGTFGHVLAAGGGWELTAQHLGYQFKMIYPTTLNSEELNPDVLNLDPNIVFQQPREFREGVAGKMSIGVGGIHVCVLSRPWG